ncbi:hypothetical protein GUJ93_ZPchr0010g9759 [Zizania palustris]|uniref:Uncharacterized protein n=1 Tax=Zizania palustris TaxID=103762 RepID=A0A8J6BCA0_ZIZPA|nr:hypothetical protein GUJ93_ZPchr0010g9759 [Zizania palustris]
MTTSTRSDFWVQKVKYLDFLERASLGRKKCRPSTSNRSNIRRHLEYRVSAWRGAREAMAAGESQLKTWVSDRLIALLGYSHGVVAQLVVRLARECASAGDLAGQLVDLGGFVASPDTAAFAEDVYGRVPRNGVGDAGVTEYQRQMEEEAAVAKKQSTFKLLDDGGGDDVSGSSSNSGSRKRFRFSRKAANEDDEAIVMQDSRRSVRWRRRILEEEDGGAGGDSDEEEEMERDQIEKAQLERNIRERDAASTRRLMDRKPTRQAQDELARRSEAMDKNDASELRRLSRHAYLQKRKEKKIEEIRDAIVDDVLLFHGDRLTAAEERDLRHKRELYGLVNDRSNSAGAGGDCYSIPEAYDAAGTSIRRRGSRLGGGGTRSRRRGTETR